MSKTDVIEDAEIVTEAAVVPIKAQQAQAAFNPAAYVQTAIEKGAGLEQLRMLMDMQIEWEKREAEKAYIEAMAEFKANPPEIKKNKLVEYKTKDGELVSYMHADLAEAADLIGRGLGKHGLAHHWIPKKEGDQVHITCIIRHKLGHSESATLSAGLDHSGKKNNIQALNSTVTYLERYTLLALSGVAAKNQDDDGRAHGDPGSVEYINADQMTVINDRLKETGSNVNNFLKAQGANSIEMIRADRYDGIIASFDRIQAKIDKDKANGNN